MYSKWFFNAVLGKTGGTFFVAILDFMDKHKFQNKIINHLYESEHECVYFFTDHLLNDVGIVTVEVFDKQFICYVGSKKRSTVHNTKQTIKIVLAY